MSLDMNSQNRNRLRTSQSILLLHPPWVGYQGLYVGLFRPKNAKDFHFDRFWASFQVHSYCVIVVVFNTLIQADYIVEYSAVCQELCSAPFNPRIALLGSCGFRISFAAFYP
jgi:hypothetical protein